MRWIYLATIIHCLIPFITEGQVDTENGARFTVNMMGGSKSVNHNNNQVVIQYAITQGMQLGAYISNNGTVIQGFLHPSIYDNFTALSVTEIEFSVYPNPFSDRFYILPSREIAKELEVFIYDLRGNMIFQGKYYSNNEIEVSVPSLPPNMYVLSIRYEDLLQTQRIIRR